MGKPLPTGGTFPLTSVSPVDFNSSSLHSCSESDTPPHPGILLLLHFPWKGPVSRSDWGGQDSRSLPLLDVWVGSPASRPVFHLWSRSAEPGGGGSLLDLCVCVRLSLGPGGRRLLSPPGPGPGVDCCPLRSWTAVPSRLRWLKTSSLCPAAVLWCSGSHIYGVSEGQRRLLPGPARRLCGRVKRQPLHPSHSAEPPEGRLPEAALPRPGWGNSTRCTLPSTASAWPESGWNQPCFFLFFPSFSFVFFRRRGSLSSFWLSGQLPEFPRLSASTFGFSEPRRSISGL